jgi:carbonic anhydrase
MLKNKIAIVIASALLSSATYAGTGGHGEHAHWGYSGSEGPAHWAKLSPEFAACGKGRNQSPIDIRNAAQAKLPPIKFDYATRVDDLVNNGHTVQANMVPGSSITVDGIQFNLKQFHFHTPSENLVDGNHYPKEGDLAVVAILFEEGPENSVLKRLWKHMPQHVDEHDRIDEGVNPQDLLPVSRHYYRFTGSLTTPPCSEGVRWYVMKESVMASEEQVKKFTKAIGADARPVQPLGARLILTDD